MVNERELSNASRVNQTLPFGNKSASLMTPSDPTTRLTSDLSSIEIPSGFMVDAIAGRDTPPHYDTDASISQRVAEEALPSAWNWPSGISSGVPALDKWHYDFLKALNEVATSKDHEFCCRYGAFVAKAEHAFLLEERWMEEIDFPILKVCQEQHARVLGALHNVHSHVMGGDLGLGREVIDQLLPRWFAFHASTVDATLALAIQMAQAEKAPLSDGSIGTYGGHPLTS